jgi:hypothetical protein
VLHFHRLHIMSFIKYGLLGGISGVRDGEGVEMWCRRAELIRLMIAHLGSMITQSGQAYRWGRGDRRGYR